jgi:hypothetical protein
MPKRVIDFDAMWGSDKLAACADWAQAEYAWLYGLADASGCFELTNLRVIWGRVAAIRGNLSIERLEQVFGEFQDKGLLFVWEHEGKRYGHWTGSDVPGRLPAPSWRVRLERFAPPVPKQLLAEYMAKFARGRAALAGAGFGGELPRAVDGERGLKAELEKAQAQDLGLEGNWNRNGDGNRNAETERRSWGAAEKANQGKELNSGDFSNSSSNSNSTDTPFFFPKDNDNSNAKANTNPIAAFNSKANGKANTLLGSNSNANPTAHGDAGSSFDSRMDSDATRGAEPVSQADRQPVIAPRNFSWSDKEAAVQRELRVGQGPGIGTARVRPEILERERKRQ